MNSTARKRSFGIRSFAVCFYCNENFRNVSTLFKHSCPAEEKISIDLEPLQPFSDVDDVDLTQENWETLEPISGTNDIDIGVENSAISETVSEKLSDDVRPENTEEESNMSNACENSLPRTESECDSLSENNSNAARQVITDLASESPEKRHLDANTGVVMEPSEQDKRDEVTELSSDASENQLPDVVKSVPDLASDTSLQHSLVANLDIEQKITAVESNADDELNRDSADLALKVLQYYEKQTKQVDPDSYCKSPPSEVVFHSPLPAVESSSSRHDNTRMECSASDVCSKGLSSELKCDTNEENIEQKEMDTLNPNTEGLESNDSNMCSRPSSPEIDSPGMLSRSSSIEMDLDRDESSDSDVSLLGKKLKVLQDDCVHKELNDIGGKSVIEENLNITKYGSVILKPCYVKVQDIFKRFSSPKLSPQKIFSWKKKYHVCDVCNKFFRSRSDLNIHYLIHTCDKPFVCSICGKSFVKQCNLFAHHLAHTIERPYKCSICKKAFPKKSVLQRHKLIHTKHKQFACDICDKTYTVKSSLDEHKLVHSGVRPFICEICNASFHNKRYLRKHYISHSKREDHVCEFCFKVFKRKHHLDEHYNIHLNETPNKCKICGKSFHLLLTLNNHYINAHRNERYPKENVKTFFSEDSKSSKDPVIQRIEIAPIVNINEMTPVKKIEIASIVVASEETPVIKFINSVDHESKETISYKTRRKSFTPRKYLQPN